MTPSLSQKKWRVCQTKTLILEASTPHRHVTQRSLTADQWQEIDKYMEKMGYGDKHQYALVHHNDKDHDHCHLIINGIY